jgi:hypothetical protein
MLLETKDTSLWDEIKALFVNREKYFWDDLPIHVKARIKKSIKQSKNGLVIPHKEFMKKYQKYL